MDKWNEMRTAYKLAKHKTLSATAKELGVHRSTVMRHIDTLENNLSIVLFQRNDKGYIPTEAGLKIMQLGEITENQFDQLSNQLRHHQQELEGLLKITCLAPMASLLMPIIKEYQTLYSKMRIEIISDVRNYNLEYGEADIALRISAKKPQTLDNVVMPLISISTSFCVHTRYIAEYGMPNDQNLHEHKFIAFSDRPAHIGWNEWIYDNIDNNNIVFVANDQQFMQQALINGCGIGFAPVDLIHHSPELIEVFQDKQWNITLWALIHRDMIKMPKIKKFLELLTSKTLKIEKW